MSHKPRSYRGEQCHCTSCEIARKNATARRVADLVRQDVRDIFEAIEDRKIRNSQSTALLRAEDKLKELGF